MDKNIFFKWRQNENQRAAADPTSTRRRPPSCPLSSTEKATSNGKDISLHVYPYYWLIVEYGGSRRACEFHFRVIYSLQSYMWLRLPSSFTFLPFYPPFFVFHLLVYNFVLLRWNSKFWIYIYSEIESVVAEGNFIFNRVSFMEVSSNFGPCKF